MYVKTGLISKSFSKGVKSRLNSDPLSKTTFRGPINLSPMGTGYMPIQRSEDLTALYLFVHLLVFVGLKLYLL